MARECVFCDGTPVTLEHVWPDWVRRTLFKGKKATKHVYSIDDEPVREWIAPPPSVKARIVCEPCNTGWMSDLEAEAGPLLLRMARGKPIRLKAAEQRLVGKWALKTALMFLYAIKEPGEQVNPVFCHSFYEHLEHALPSTHVWVASCDPRHASAHYRHRNLWPAEDGIVGFPRGIVSAFQLHGVILLTYMHTVDRNVSFEAPWIRTLLPASGIVSWPIRKTFPIEAFGELTELFFGRSPTD